MDIPGPENACKDSCSLAISKNIIFDRKLVSWLGSW